MSEQSLLQDLSEVINRHCAENASDTPDFILAEYLHRCLDTWTATTKARDAWYGRPCGGGAAIRDSSRSVQRPVLPGDVVHIDDELSAAEQGGLC